MSEQTVNQIIPQQGATNETLIGDLSSYFRYDEATGQHSMLMRINPSYDGDVWTPCDRNVYRRIVNEVQRPAVGAVIHDLNRALVEKNEQDLAHRKFAQDAYRAIEIIGERLIHESDRRGWCDEFDRIIQEVNETLPGGFQLPEREKEYEVTWTQTVTVTVDCSATFTASNEDDAREMAAEYEDAVDTESILAAVRRGNWETDYDGDSDYEVTEV